MNALKRALRTFLQSWSGIFLALWVSSGLAAKQLPDVSDLTVIAKLAVAAAIASLPALVSLLQNALEDADVVPTLAKKEGS